MVAKQKNMLCQNETKVVNTDNSCKPFQLETYLEAESTQMVEMGYESRYCTCCKKWQQWKMLIVCLEEEEATTWMEGKASNYYHE